MNTLHINAVDNIHVNYHHTAAVDVDPQNSFTSLCPDELPVSNALDIIPEILKNHTKGRLKIISRDLHPTNALWENHEITNLPVNIDQHWPRHCIMGTYGAKLIKGLPPIEDYDLQVNKGMDMNAHPYGIFFYDLANTKSTGVYEYLRYHQIDTLVLGGLAFDICLKITAMQAISLGFNVIVNLAATKAVDIDSIELIVEELQKLGVRFVANATYIHTM